ncbi:hypothetical protein DN412_09225 [Cupriavidus lacunae]|uniref:Uncharacterized protein n=2 Tax=Cupriavidus TaxID=106589 RepID=A0A370NYV3_9BURK|nr:hypothetical protein DN412_09225 [Cupriavidus lacunae]
MPGAGHLFAVACRGAWTLFQERYFFGRRFSAYAGVAIISRQATQEFIMAKSQLRSSREAKKPKQPKKPSAPASPFSTVQVRGGHDDVAKKKK